MLKLPLHALAWAVDMEILVCPSPRIPLSVLLVESEGKAGPVRSGPGRLQELPVNDIASKLPYGAPLRFFFVGVCSLSLWLSLATTRQWDRNPG